MNSLTNADISAVLSIFAYHTTQSQPAIKLAYMAMLGTGQSGSRASTISAGTVKTLTDTCIQDSGKQEGGFVQHRQAPALCDYCGQKKTAQ